MKLLESTKNNTTEDNKCRKNAPLLEITGVILVHFHVLTTVISKNHKFCIYLLQINDLVH